MTECVQFHTVENSRQKEPHRKKRATCKCFGPNRCGMRRVSEPDEEQSCLDGEYTPRRLDRYAVAV